MLLLFSKYSFKFPKLEALRNPEIVNKNDKHEKATKKSYGKFN